MLPPVLVEHCDNDLSSVSGQAAVVSTEGRARAGVGEGAGADEGFTAAQASESMSIERTKAPSSCPLPKRGLPNEIIAAILQEDCLDLDDYARCALVSRTFGKLTHTALYSSPVLKIQRIFGADGVWSTYVSDGSTGARHRLRRSDIASATRALRMTVSRYAIPVPRAVDDINPCESPPPYGDALGIDVNDDEALLATLPKLHTLEVEPDGGFCPGNEDMPPGISGPFAP